MKTITEYSPLIWDRVFRRQARRAARADVLQRLRDAMRRPLLAIQLLAAAFAVGAAAIYGAVWLAMSFFTVVLSVANR